MSIMTGESIYTNTAAFKGGRALTEDELRKIVPSMFSQEAHHSRSERFQHISTWDAVKALRKEGFDVVGAKQTRIADPSRQPFGKHLLRIRRLNDGKVYNVGDNVFELLLSNANDGTSKYELMGGLFRIACLNSLVHMQSVEEHVSVLHKGNKVISQVVEGSLAITKKADLVLSAPDNWSKVRLDTEAQYVLATHIHKERFKDIDGVVTTPIPPETLLIPRREEDRRDDLWTVFNVCQENAIKGGLSAKGRDFRGRERVFTSKVIKGIDKEVSLNQEFWRIGLDMYNILKDR